MIYTWFDGFKAAGWTDVLPSARSVAGAQLSRVFAGAQPA